MRVQLRNEESKDLIIASGVSWLHCFASRNIHLNGAGCFTTFTCSETFSGLSFFSSGSARGLRRGTLDRVPIAAVDFVAL